MKRPPQIIVQFVHFSGPLKGKTQSFSEDRITIGRKSTCHLYFPPDTVSVSREHAEIVREGNQFKLIDHSTNGTLVNGNQIQEIYLKNGDILEFSKDGPKVSFLTEMRDAPAEPERPEPLRQPVAQREYAEPALQKKIIQPARQSPELPALQKSKNPLTIQYGPTIRSFNELPITIGKNPACDFTLDDPALLDRQAQIFYGQNQYWIKDLTGRKSVLLNKQPVDVQAPLNVNDVIALSPQGPVFRFIGEGRLVEVAEPVAEKSLPKSSQPETAPKNEPGGLASRIRSFLDKKLK